MFACSAVVKRREERVSAALSGATVTAYHRRRTARGPWDDDDDAWASATMLRERDLIARVRRTKKPETLPAVVEAATKAPFPAPLSRRRSSHTQTPQQFLAVVLAVAAELGRDLRQTLPEIRWRHDGFILRYISKQFREGHRNFALTWGLRRQWILLSLIHI